LLAFVDAAARTRDQGLGAAQRREGGVVHTPVAVARAMLREADALLARNGLPPIGAPGLEVLDPAMGPGVFVAAALAHARGDGARLTGIDVDPAAAARTRAALGRFATARGWALAIEARDALARGHDVGAPGDRPGGAALLVVGNPPWSARGRGPAYVERLLADFHVDERRRGVLADAYVRFLRWAMDAIERAPGGGAIVLVTNASYLDGPVHRGLRAALCARFDEVSILDLGGSALVARAPGTVDGNVFGVRPGAAVLLAARRASPGRRAPLDQIGYRAVTGDAAAKLRALAARTPSSPTPSSPTPFDAAPFDAVREPVASFRPRRAVEAGYTRWPSLAEWLPWHAEGVQTNRDAFVIDRDRAPLLERLREIAAGRVVPPARPHFDPRAAAREVRELLARGELEAHVRPLAYRPFDARLAFLHASLCHRPRPPLLAAMARSPLALVSVRQDRGALPWAHVALVRAPIDNCYLSARSSCRARAFPSHAPGGAPNLGPSIAAALSERGVAAVPEDVLAYLAAVLSSASYVERFGAALALDYPRVPLPPDRAAFERLAARGREIAAALAGEAAPVTARAGRALARVGHHAFDPEAPAVRALLAARAALEDDVRALIG
jgi:predicted RNA methylase